MKSTMNPKRICLCIVLALLLLINMTMIFYNSSLDADSSNGISTGMATAIYNQTDKKDSVKDKPESQNKISSETAELKEKSETPEQKIEREAKEKAQAEKEEYQRTSKILNYNTKLRDVFHMLEFLSLSFLCVLLFLVSSMSRMRFNMAISLVFCALYAFSDEIHQIFVDGRSFEVGDLLLDCTGVATGILLGCALFILLKDFIANKN